MIKRFRLYLIFIVVGLVVTGANLSIYLAISRSASRNSIAAPKDGEVAVGGSSDLGSSEVADEGLKKQRPDIPVKTVRRGGDPARHEDKAAEGIGRHHLPVVTDAKRHHPKGHHEQQHEEQKPVAESHHRQHKVQENPTPAPHHQRHQKHEADPHQAEKATEPVTLHDAKEGSKHHKKRKGEQADEAGNNNKDEHHHAKHEEADGAKKKPPPPKFKKHKGAYVAYDSNRTEFYNKTYDEALEQYKSFLGETLKDELEQSSRLFRDILERSDSGVKLPTSPAELQSMFGILPDDESPPHVGETVNGSGSSAAAAALVKPYCDPLDADYTPESDELCQQYLRDIRNWQSIKPMSSILSSGRTIKFKVFYKHNDISAVLKVSQKKFALEPASEVVAYHVDRTLGFDRVPPVVWAPFPIPFLQAACSSMDAFYAQWFEKFSLKYSSVQPLISSGCFPNGIKCVNVSLQLWLFDVHNAEDTMLKPSQSYEKYLALPAADQAAVDKLKPGGSPNDRSRIAYGELMDEFVFDLIIGNTDRWFGHNSFVLGGCERSCPESSERRKTKSTVRYAFIDQGSSFYRNGVPDMNPFLSHYEHLCRFRGRTVEAVLRASRPSDPSEAFHEVVKAKLPKGIFHLANRELVQSSTKRLGMLAQHMQYCLGNYSREDVMFF